MTSPLLPRVSAALLAAALLSGCLPWPRKALVVPGLRFEVKDERGEPLPGALVSVVRFSEPHAQYEDQVRARTNEQGHAVFTEATEWETVWPLLPHGIPFYDFVYCVSAPEHGAVGGRVPDPVADVYLRLSPGSGECPSPTELIRTARGSTVAFARED